MYIDRSLYHLYNNDLLYNRFATWFAPHCSQLVSFQLDRGSHISDFRLKQKHIRHFHHNDATLDLAPTLATHAAWNGLQNLHHQHSKVRKSDAKKSKTKNTICSNKSWWIYTSFTHQKLFALSKWSNSYASSLEFETCWLKSSAFYWNNQKVLSGWRENISRWLSTKSLWTLNSLPKILVKTFLQKEAFQKFPRVLKNFSKFMLHETDWYFVKFWIFCNKITFIIVKAFPFNLDVPMILGWISFSNQEKVFCFLFLPSSWHKMDIRSSISVSDIKRRIPDVSVDSVENPFPAPTYNPQINQETHVSESYSFFGDVSKLILVTKTGQNKASFFFLSHFFEVMVGKIQIFKTSVSFLLIYSLRELSSIFNIEDKST